MTDRKQQNQSTNTDHSRQNHKNPDTPQQGSVQHSDDGRLKENREKGVHRGDKE
ncbi:hypothetical protein [Methylobacterium radiodurans]|uniref:hypothetical protein n=1 Tax=Methylobacterium radiodurans TaxID=2202828 RepID=UPI0013A53D47|nr:hypothetical protein [Methylobacterium radiodurans]